MKKQSSSLLGFVVVFLVGIACCKCGIADNKAPTETSSRSLFSANATATYTPVPTSTVTASVSAKTSANLKSLKTAMVVSESANLRKTANQTALAITEVSEGTEIEIIKQKAFGF